MGIFQVFLTDLFKDQQANHLESKIKGIYLLDQYSTLLGTYRDRYCGDVTLSSISVTNVVL